MRHIAFRFLPCAAVASVLSGLFAAAFAIPPTADKPQPNAPKVAEASNEGELAISGFRVPDFLKAELFAAEPLVANPVTFCIDERGRLYVGESFRQQKGVEDNRNHMVWLQDDLALQTVDDRLAMFHKHLKDKVHDYTLEDDRIRLLEDTTGDGRADRSTVFAAGFNGILEGTGAGLLARQGDVYYTCIPHLWKLRDSSGDGAADVREPLHRGFGVRVAFRGHDMHGLCFGPDGRLYFSIGDRGFHVTTPEGKVLARPDTGAVFRCWPDGSQLEVFAYGLRNPQELAFDDFGNLFTGDNNSDSGDKARWVYVAAGGDSGWRMYYQYLRDRGPFNRERIWHPYRSDPQTAALQPACIVPPVANLADGPSGLVYYPGVGLPERYDGHFFLADFRGNSARSGIRSFAVKPKGASFELVDSHEFLWQILATDVDFGYDGSLYVSDWVDGWNGPGKGRIYRFYATGQQQAIQQTSAAALMRDGFSHRNPAELVELLSHRDRRIRQEAQFALAERNASTELLAVAERRTEKSVFPRLHAVWGLGQILSHKANAKSLDRLLKLLDDPDAEVRSQAIRVLSDIMAVHAGRGRPLSSDAEHLSHWLVNRLRDESPRVRYFAALGLGTCGIAQSLPPVLDLLAENQDEDPLLRHAAVMAVAGIANASNRPAAMLAAVQSHPSRSARLGVLLAMRRLQLPAIAAFLNDSDPTLVLEAARAIHDEPIRDAYPQLAQVLERPGLADPLLRRSLNAGFVLGTKEQAIRVASIAANASIAEDMRLEALEMLKTWAEPGPLDRVLGDFRPIEKRPADFVPDLLRPALGGILSGPDKVRQAGASLAAVYGIREVVPALVAMLQDLSRPAEVRVAALQAVESLKDSQLPVLTERSLQDSEPRLRAAARRILARIDPDRAVKELDAALAGGSTIERQQAVQVLASLRDPQADGVLAAWVTKLLEGEVAPEVQLDLLEAARARNTKALQEQLARFDASLPPDDKLAAWRVALAGGDVERGREIFFGRSEVSCRRCHKIQGEGGEVGPDLSKIGIEKNREYLLEAIVAPNARIAKGFETVVLVLQSGKVHVGLIREETPKQIRLMLPSGEIVVVPVSDIEDRVPGKSAMPEEILKELSRSDVRDLVEYLASLRTADTAAAP